MADATRYLNSVAWRTYARNIIKLNDWDYRVSVDPIDVNEPGAATATKEIGFYFKDNIGHTYSIIGTSILTIDVSDDFRTGVGPQSGLQGVIYKSVWKGRSPYLAPIFYRHLNREALDYSRQIELDILWSNDPNARRIPFVNVNQPSIPDYRANIVDSNGITFNPMEDYGQNPQFQIFQLMEDGTYSQIFLGENYTINNIDGLIDSVLFSGTGELITGYILIKN